MNRNKPFLFVVLLAGFALASCSGLPGGGCVANCTNGNATVSVTMLSTPLTPEASTNILSMTTNVTGVTLMPATGTAQTISLPSPFTIDLNRLQSDSVFLGTLSSVPAGTYTVSVSFTAPVILYCTQLNAGTPGCASGTVTRFSGNAQSPSISTTLTLIDGQTTGVALNFNLQNALTINPQTQAVTAIDFTASNALTLNTLPSTTSSLAAGQLDVIEDITGVVSAASPTSVTIQTATHGSITALTNASTVFISGTAPLVGQLATMDATINSDGTFTVLEFESLVNTSTDFLEGVVTSTPTSSTQFEMVVNNVAAASTNSVLGSNASSILGSPVNISLVNASAFLVDIQTLTVPVSAVASFESGNDATILQPGQTVAVLLTSFTAASGNVLASANADALELRFSRVSGTVGTTGPQFQIQNLPSFFGQTTPALVQISAGTGPTSQSTNFDGVSSSTLQTGNTVSIRALYFGPVGATTPFSAAKVRVP